MKLGPINKPTDQEMKRWSEMPSFEVVLRRIRYRVLCTRFNSDSLDGDLLRLHQAWKRFKKAVYKSIFK